jgi:hypothetical protein
MEFRKLFIGAVLMASSAISSAQINNTYTIDLTTGDGGVYSGSIGNTFTSADKGKSFLDIYSFTLPSISDLDAALTSIATVSRSVTKLDLDINQFDLYVGATKVASGDVFSSGLLDVRTLTSSSLPGGLYRLQVGGMVLGNSGGSYGGNINVAPVPEPETWSMIFAGAAVVGFLSRRRRQAGSRPAGAPA